MHAIRGERLRITLHHTPARRFTAPHATRIDTRLHATLFDDAPATAVPRRLAFRAAATAAALAARPSSAQAVTTILADADAIDQPPTDQRRYRLVALSNGLRALLVSDETAETAAAALDVHVGYACDPSDRPGVAHFCEHMLFLGNKQYPREGAFAEYVQRRGGSSNAYTAAEDTCYHFDVDASDFEGALDRFSAFFEAPTFSPLSLIHI